MFIIGLTGLIGSGKTTVSNLFASLGVPVIDTDVIAHQLTSNDGKAIPMIKTSFGNDIIDTAGMLDRIRLREMVFASDELRLELEGILHPLIFNEVKGLIKNFADKQYVLLVVPLLFRSKKYLDLTIRNIFVDSDYEFLLNRVMIRNNLHREQVDMILAKQVSRAEQLAMADDIIINNNGLDNLVSQVEALHSKYMLLG